MRAFGDLSLSGKGVQFFQEMPRTYILLQVLKVVPTAKGRGSNLKGQRDLYRDWMSASLCY